MHKKKSRRLDFIVQELRRNKQIVFALVFLALIILTSLLITLSPVDPDEIAVEQQLQGPSAEHWFGTDELGRDYFTRVLYGGRITLLVATLAMLTSVLIGVTIGLLSGYFGGIIDTLCMRFVDILSAIPWIILVTVISVLFRRGLFSIIIVIGLFGWMEIARLVRSEVLSARERDYVGYAHFIGRRSGAIILEHLIPTILPTIITAATGAIAAAIMIESALSFLGLGVSAPMSSWGSLLQSSQQYLQKAPHMAILPGILIILTVYSFSKLGDLVRVMVEPRVAGD